MLASGGITITGVWQLIFGMLINYPPNGEGGSDSAAVAEKNLHFSIKQDRNCVLTFMSTFFFVHHAIC